MGEVSKEVGHASEAPPHPDGLPWRKACDVCAFRRCNPQGMSEDEFDEVWLMSAFPGFTFYCEHREDDGFVRECACHRAIQAGKVSRGEA